GGYIYPFLSRHVSVVRGLRALARLGIFVDMFLAVLAAYGYVALAEARARTARLVLVTVLAAAMLLEYRVTLTLVDYPNAPTPVHKLLARFPRGVVAEFPAPRADALPGDDAEYAYLTSWTWDPLVNGYSGVYPASYLARLDRLRDFPGDRSLQQIRRDG